MATDGTPEPAAKRCGEAIARLRTARRWSRTQFIIRLFDELTPDDPSYDSISETWLARLENGRMVKVPRQTVEALCRALRCTPQERAWVLLHADRSVLADHEHEPTAAAEVLTYVMDRLYVEAGELLNALVAQHQEAALSEDELLEATATALNGLIARRQHQAASTHARMSSQAGSASPHARAAYVSTATARPTLGGASLDRERYAAHASAQPAKAAAAR